MDDTIDEESVDEESINSDTTMNRLEQLVEKRCWESVFAHLQTIQGREDAMKRNSTLRRRVYFNREFYDHAPFHVIEALVKAYPEGIVEPFRRNITADPIETVLWCTNEETRNRVFKLFFETNPKCFDNCSFYFFHEACVMCDTEVLKLMIQANPKFLYQRNTNSALEFLLPLHTACSRDRCEKIDLMLAFDPLLARMVDHNSKMLALHIACTRSHDIFNLGTFRRLIEAYPQAAKVKDSKERLPLHYVCKETRFRPDTPDFFGEVFKIYPEAAKILDKQKNLPLHYLVICNNLSPHQYEDLAPQVRRQIGKPLAVLIETYPDALLQRDEENQLVLGRMAERRCPFHHVWHTAGRLCTHAFICATQESMQPLRQISCELPALVANFMESPLDWTTREGVIQDGELTGIILHYTFQALLEANNGLDTNSNLPSGHNVLRCCLPVDNNQSTAKTTLLHKLAYCSKFCNQQSIMHAVDLYVSRKYDHFFQSDNNGNLPLHLVCCAPPPMILVGEYEMRCSEKTKASLVETFLTPCMEAASKTNYLGKTPLDILMETESELSELNIESWGGVELLVTANPTEANKLFTKEKMYLFMIAAIGEQANLSFTFSMLLSFVLVQNLDDLGSTTIVTKIKKQKVSRK